MSARIFPDICPRALRIAEVKSWSCPWMTRTLTYSRVATIEPRPVVLRPPHEDAAVVTPATSKHDESNVAIPLLLADAHCLVTKEQDHEIEALTDYLSLEEKEPTLPLVSQMTENAVVVGTPSPGSTPRSRAPLWKAAQPGKTGSSGSKRPQLRLKLEDMPTPQQAEERAQRAATRLIAKRDAMEAAAIVAAASSGSTTPANGPSAAQQAMMRLNLSSDSDSDLQSSNGAARHLFSCCC